MFKQFRDGIKLPKIIAAMKAGQAAINVGRFDVARSRIVTAYNMSLDTTFPRSAHINLTTFWGLMGVSLQEKGQNEIADHCLKMSNLLQSRFEAGDYYREPWTQ